MAMTLITAYDEATFTEFLRAEMGRPLEAVLQYDYPASYYPAVEETCIRLGIDDPSGETDLLKLRGLGRVYLWEKAAGHAAALYNHAADGASFNRDRVQEKIAWNLSRAKSEALAAGYLDADVMTPMSMTYSDDVDPYQTREDDE